jgi:hypothetical protein
MVRCAEHSYPILMATFEHVDDNNQILAFIKSIQYWLVIEKMDDYQPGFKGKLFIINL